MEMNAHISLSMWTKSKHETAACEPNLSTRIKGIKKQQVVN
jgi:hypothetical protein